MASCIASAGVGSGSVPQLRQWRSGGGLFTVEQPATRLRQATSAPRVEGHGSPRGKTMRKFLLVSVTLMGIGSVIGAAFAQPIGAPTQGQQAWPTANPPASANNNNNYQARVGPGPGVRCPNCEVSPGWITCPSC